MANSSKQKKVWMYAVPSAEMDTHGKGVKPYTFISLMTQGEPSLYPADWSTVVAPLFIEWEQKNGYAGTADWFDCRWSWSRQAMMSKSLDAAIRHAERVLDPSNEFSYEGLVA